MTEYINKEFYQQIPANERYFIKLSQEAAYAVVKEFEAANIPHSATISEYRSIVTVNKADSVTAEKIAENAAKAFPASARTILGNTEYKYIRDKKYIDTDADTARKIAALLSGNVNNRFSGIIRGEKATITVSGEKNAAAVRAMAENFKNLDLLEALRERGFERTADTNGFVNIRNIETGETCGFNGMAAVRDMFDNPENEFFYPLSYRIAYRENPSNGDYYYYVQKYNSADKSSAKAYRDENNKPAIFKSVDEALSYTAKNGIKITNIDEEIVNWRVVDREREDNSIIKENRKLIESFPISGGNYVDLIKYNPNTENFSWVYFNSNGDNGSGEFVDKTVTKEDIFAAYSVRIAAESKQQGRNNFIAYLNENCKEDVIPLHSGYFAEYADDYINYASRNFAYYFGISENSIATNTIDLFISHLELNCNDVNMDKHQREQPQEITESSFRVELDGYAGAWNVIENAEIDGRELFMLESDTFGDSLAYIVADKYGNVIDDNVWGDFEEYENRLVKRRLIEAAEKVDDGTTMPVLKEFADDMRRYGFEVSENNGIFTARKEDISSFVRIDIIAEMLYDISEKYRFEPNEAGNNHLLDLNRFYDSYDWESYSEGKNVLENTIIALQSGNFEPIENYIEQVQSVCVTSTSNSMGIDEGKIREAAEHLEKFKAVFDERSKSALEAEEQFPNGELSDESETAEIPQESNIHFGYFGNGVLCYDTSRLDKKINDYVSVAHISSEGNIRYYVDDLSENDKQSIENHAKGVKERFTAYWNELPLLTRYGMLYDRLLDTGNVEQIRAFDADHSIADMSEKVKKYEHSIIFRDEDFPVKNSAEMSFQEALDDLIKEKNKEAVEKIEVGGEITLNNEIYVIKNIDGDYSLSMEKKGDSNADIKRYVGNWKEQLLSEAGDNALFVYSAVLANDLDYINAVNSQKSKDTISANADNDEIISDDTDRTDNNVKFLTDNIPDLDNETAERLVNAFAASALTGWDSGESQVKINRIKKSLFDILSDEDKTEKAYALISKNVYNHNSDTLDFRFGGNNGREWFTESELLHNFAKNNRNISFALANAVFGYLDEKQHAEREIDELKAGWYDKADFKIKANIDGELFDYEGRFDIGDGIGTGGGTLVDHIRQRNEYIIKSDKYPYNTKEAKDEARLILDVFVPFLEQNTEMTREEEEKFTDFKENHPIRTSIYKDELSDDDFEIFQVKSGDEYLYKRFMDLSALGQSPIMSDYNRVYKGKLSEIDVNAEYKDDILNNIFTKFNINRPDDFKGHSLSVSDIVVLHKDGIDTAHYVDDVGFKDIPEFLQQKVKEQSHTSINDENTPIFKDKSDKIEYAEKLCKAVGLISEQSNRFKEMVIGEHININVQELSDIISPNTIDIDKATAFISNAADISNELDVISITGRIYAIFKEFALNEKIDNKTITALNTLDVKNGEDYIDNSFEALFDPTKASITDINSPMGNDLDKMLDNSEKSVLSNEKAYIYSEIKFETGEVYLVPDKISDDNVSETQAYKEILGLYADKDKIDDLDDMIRVNIRNFRYGSGVESIPSDEEIEFIRENSTDVINKSEEIGNTEFFAHFWKNVDDVLNDLESKAAEQHKTSKKVGDGYEEQTYIFPTDYSSDYPNYSGAVTEIKVSGEWFETEKAVKNMNSQGNTDTSQIEALRVRTVSFDGIERSEELSPEAFHIILDRTKKNKDEMKEAAELYEKNDGNIMPVYTKTPSEAAEAGERDIYFAHMRENERCAESMRYSIICNNDGMHFNSDKAISELMSTYSIDRIALIIAARVSEVGEWDRRYSRKNFEWARNVVKDYPAKQVEEIRYFPLNNHPILLNAVLDELRSNFEMFRNMQEEKISETKSADNEQQKFNEDIKNLNQLKKALAVGTEFIITDHSRKDSIGERRVITSVKSTGFYSKNPDMENAKDLWLDWGKAGNWKFENGVCTSSLDNNEMIMSFKVLEEDMFNVDTGEIRRVTAEREMNGAENAVRSGSVKADDDNSPMGNYDSKTEDAENAQKATETNNITKLTEVQKKSIEIAKRYERRSMQDKIDIIAQAFGGTTGKIVTSPCTGKWRGTSDISIVFDNGKDIYIGNSLTPQAKTVKVQNEYLNSALVQYNPEIIKVTKEAALETLRKRQDKDNEIAAEKGIKPYTLLNVEFNDTVSEINGGYLGWYYVTLAVDGKIRAHMETGLYHDILDGKTSETPNDRPYCTAALLKDTDVDYVFDNVGFSLTAKTNTLPISDEVRERAERTLDEITRMQNVENAVRSDRDISNDSNSPIGNLGEERHIPAAEITIGDKFLYRGKEVTVSSLIGIYPDEIGVSRIEKSGGIEFEIASNVDKFTLAKDGIYLGNAEKSKSEEKAVYTDEPITAEEENSKFDEQKIISAFDKLKANHSFSPDAEKFLERTVKQLILNKFESIDPKMFKSPIFSHHYGTMVRINDKLFDGKFMQLIDEATGYISGNGVNDVQKESLSAEDNSPLGNFEPQINDVVENDEGVYKIVNISGNYVTLLEADTLLPDEKLVSMTDFYKSNFTLLERDKIISEAANTEKSLEIAEKTVENVENSVNKAENYVITNENSGEIGSAKNRYAANIAAINVLKSIEAENRAAAPAEQDILAGYTGWGAIPQAFDRTNTKWSNEYAELKELLTEKEYEAARHSILNAHYTSPTVISAMYDVLNNLGFDKGNILEPAMGTGNFFGMLPELYKDSKLYGVELDSITGRIAQQLYPNADIQVTGYEKTSFPDKCFDVAIGNVPFGDYRVSDKRYNDCNFNIHDYFFAKTLDKVRGGGIIAFVTSKGTMDKENDEIRRYIAERAELLGAVRLPNNAFKAIAGTEVTSDILILQKRERPIKIKPDSIEWLKKAETADGLSVNNYFVQHPEMVLGKITEGNKLYGNSKKDTSCIPIEGADLKQQLAEAIKNIKGTYKASAIEIDPKGKETIPAPANSRKFSFIEKNGSIYYREAENTMKKVNVPKDIFNRALAMTELRDTVHELLNLQLENSLGYLDDKVAESRKKLNTLYDSFVKKYGNISSPKNAKAFKGDSGYFVLSALENKDENGKVIGKADIFTKNTVKPKIIASHVETAEEALILSVSEKGKINFDFMTELCGMDKNKLISELDGQIYKLPQETEKYVTADEYLTGNIRKKMLDIANSENPKAYEKNYNALKAAMPPRVEAKDISVKLGSHWVDPAYIRQFILEKFKPDARTEAELNVVYSKVAGTWKVEGQTATAKTNHTATNTYGTRRKNAYEIIEGILNNSDLLVKDRAKDEFGDDKLNENGRYILVTNEEETKAVRHCANIIKSEFADWIFKDPDRRNDLVNKYNEIFNSFRYREYDGSHLNFVGMNTDITLKEHQRNAIARGLYGGNTLLAHAVGAGKTYEMIAIAMEGKRLGLHNKSLFAVPNSLTEQIGNDFRKLYPNANILVATKKDFEKDNRAKLLAKMATNDWDAVIIGHSQFDRMGLSPERESEYLYEEIEKLRAELEKMKAENPKRKSFTEKNIEKSITSYTKRLDDLKNKQVKDDFIDFEQLGFDKIFVDECHMYKNLATATKMRNVAGLGSRGSARAFNLFMKAKYLDELTDGKGCIFSSGTPVSNSMTELYTLMRYLQADTLKDLGIEHFDEWAADFGEVVTDYELKPESDGKYQLKTRFAKFTNLPELMAIFKQAADIRTADTLDLEKPVSVVKEIMAKPSRIQKRGIKDLGERATAIRHGNVNPHVDNMLCVTNDGRKIGLDQRLLNPALPDDPNSKVNMCVQNVFDIYTQTAEKKSTQCIFCDLSTPKTESRQDRFTIYRPDEESETGYEIIRKKNGIKKDTYFPTIKDYVSKNADEDEDKLKYGDIAVIRRPNEDNTKIISEAAVFENGKFNKSHSVELLEKLEMSPVEDMPPKEFNIYDDIKNKLVERGVSEKEIAFIHDYDTAEKKQGLFNKMNAGEVRILLGSTSKCGAGMNAQRKMIALHHLDAPMRPSDMEQRNGRIERQGNENPEVQIYRYVTDRTFDAYLYQMLENKQKFISQVMTSKTPERVCADIDEAALDYAEVKALCAGNPLIKEEMELQNKIKDLKMEKSRYSENLYEMQDKIRVKYPEEIRISELINKHNQEDLDTANAAEFIINDEGKKVYPIEIGGVKYTDRKEGGNAIKTALGANIGKIAEGKTVEIGTYRGMKLSVYQHSLSKKIGACLEGNKNHYCELNPETDIGNVVRLDNCINNIAEGIKKTAEEIAAKRADLEVMKIEVEKPFSRADELFKAETRLEEVHIELTKIEQNDDSKEKDLFERLCDIFPDVITGKRKSVQIEALGDIHTATLKGDMLTLTKDDGNVVTGTVMQIDYENEKAMPFSLDGMELSTEKEDKNAYFANINHFFDKLEDNGFKEIEQDVQADRDNLSM